LLLQLDEEIKNSYGFRFQNPPSLAKIATIHAIGTELRLRTNGSTYYWDCSLRPDIETFIFQYTLEGQGEIKLKEKIYRLLPGDAFIISVPEECEYYLPLSSNEWKFIYITLEGEQAKKCWEHINSQHGYVFNIPIERRLVQRLLSTYIKVRDGRISSSYQASSAAFEFLNYCYQHFEIDHATYDPKISPDIAKAVEFIKKNHHLAVNLTEIAEHVELSSTYLNKKFKQEIGLPPLNYLNKYRIEKSAYLLQHTEKTVKDISFELGFSDPNYFCKAFRKAIGVSPNAFRKNQDSSYSYDFLITDQHGIIELD